MAGQTDAILARFTGELEERERFMDVTVEAAQNESRDLSSLEMEQLNKTRERITEIRAQLDPLQEAARIAHESRERSAIIQQQFAKARDPDRPGPVEYRSAGEYVIDRWRSGLGGAESRERIELYHRAAAHQTTADNPGLLPEQILGPVLNFIDTARPCVTALGPRQLPSGSFARPRVTQSTQVAAQGGEKTELVSRKMIIGKLTVTAATYGGYVNVSRQDIDFSQPQIMDIIISDLAAQYAIETENAAVDAFTAAATTGPVIATGTPTAAAVAGAIWTAAGSVYTATKGQGRVIAVTGPDMLGLVGPLFPPVDPTNAQSPGFSASGISSGVVGQISGIPVYVSAGMATLTMLVLSSAAAEVYEDRIGALQVVEPSVLGVQVAYAGHFASSPVLPAGIIKIVKTP